MAWRTTDLLSGEGGGLGPCPRDVRGSGGLGLRRNIAALRSGLRLRASARRTGLLGLTEECCYLSEAHVLGGCLGRVLLCLGNRVLLAGEGIGFPGFPHLVLVLCAEERRLTLQGPAFLPLETNSSISAVDTRHLCALRKEILLCVWYQTLRALKFRFKSLFKCSPLFFSPPPPRGWEGLAFLFLIRAGS